MTIQDQNNDYGFQIVGGPGKFDLMVALFSRDTIERDNQRSISFKLEGVEGKRIYVFILGVEHGEDEDWWLFKARTSRDFIVEVTGRFNTKSRIGNLTFHPHERELPRVISRITELRQ